MVVSCERRGLLINRGCLDTPPVFGGVHVVHLFRFLCCVLLLFVFILCLMCPVLTVSLDCPFFIAPSGFSDIYFQILRNSKKGILKFFALLVSLSDDCIRSRRCNANMRYTFSIS